MAKQKLKLTEQPFKFDFTVLAIVSQSRDYHLCWQINRELKIELRKENDLQLHDSKKRQVTYFSFYSFNDSADMCRYDFIANRSGVDFFLPEAKVADFLLVINQKPKEEIKKIATILKKLPQVLAVSELEINKLKSKRNLIFE